MFGLKVSFSSVKKKRDMNPEQYPEGFDSSGL